MYLIQISKMYRKMHCLDMHLFRFLLVVFHIIFCFKDANAVCHSPTVIEGCMSQLTSHIVDICEDGKDCVSTSHRYTLFDDCLDGDVFSSKCSQTTSSKIQQFPSDSSCRLIKNQEITENIDDHCVNILESNIHGNISSYNTKIMDSAIYGDIIGSYNVIIMHATVYGRLIDAYNTIIQNAVVYGVDSYSTNIKDSTIEGDVDYSYSTTLMGSRIIGNLNTYDVNIYDATITNNLTSYDGNVLNAVIGDNVNTYAMNIKDTTIFGDFKSYQSGLINVQVYGDFATYFSASDNLYVKGQVKSTCSNTSLSTKDMIDLNECQFNPCMNSGTCTDQMDGYMCSCQSDYTGTNCENIKTTSNQPSTSTSTTRTLSTPKSSSTTSTMQTSILGSESTTMSSNKRDPGNTTNLGLIIGLTVSIFITLLVLFVAVIIICKMRKSNSPSTAPNTSQSARYETAHPNNNNTSMQGSQPEYENPGPVYLEIDDYAEINDGTSRPYDNIENKQSFGNYQKPVRNDLQMRDENSYTGLRPESGYVEPVSKR